ncbi:MAG: hypothetical protein HW407_582 [Bacteroidetes bacterium]|nr:hypothetical protein [Bacteroidota bacterium]
MKSSFLLAVAVTLIVAMPPYVTAQSKKYDLKSGIITFVENTVMSGRKDTKKVVVYFDDYGMKERRDVYEGDRITETFFSDGRTLYTVVHSEKTAYNRGSATRGTELRFDWDEVSSKGIRDGTVRKLPNITVAGKSCESFERISSSEKIVFAGWSHICLMTELTAPKMRKDSRAVSFEENLAVPAEKFKVPRGYAVK